MPGRDRVGQAEKGRAHKDKSRKRQASSLDRITSDATVKDAAADVIASGEVTGKMFESTLLHRPAKLKAKRLLLLGGGKAKSFSAFDLRRLAGAAVRTLKVEGIAQLRLSRARNRSEGGRSGEGDCRRSLRWQLRSRLLQSDRKDQKIDALTVVARGDQARLQTAMDEARIVGESQNFTRDLVNEPRNHMTPTILAERAKKMAAEVGLKCEIYGADKIKELKMGAFWSVAQGSDEPPALIVLRYEPAGAPEKPCWAWSERASLSIPAAFPSSPATAWRR